MKRLHYLHERRQERKKCVFAKLLADMTLRAQKKNALDGIFQTLRMAKQRCERRNRKEEIKVTSKHFYGLGELFRYVRTRFSKKERLRTKGYSHTPHCRIQIVQQFISSYISIFYTLLSKV